MLKTITKFVVERRKLVRQRRQQVIEGGDSGDPAMHSEVPQREGDNSDSSRHSKVPPQLAEPQLGEPPAPTVWGKVKWYNALKRYGFVELSDGSGDAFLHASALAGISVDALQPGVTNRVLRLRAALPLNVVERERHVVSSERGGWSANRRGRRRISNQLVRAIYVTTARVGRHLGGARLSAIVRPPRSSF